MTVNLGLKLILEEKKSVVTGTRNQAIPWSAVRHVYPLAD